MKLTCNAASVWLLPRMSRISHNPNARWPSVQAARLAAGPRGVCVGSCRVQPRCGLAAGVAGSARGATLTHVWLRGD